jgi:hypothetical protein
VDLHDAGLRSLVPELAALFEQSSLGDALEARMPDLALRKGTQVMGRACVIG